MKIHNYSKAVVKNNIAYNGSRLCVGVAQLITKL